MKAIAQTQLKLIKLSENEDGDEIELKRTLPATYIYQVRESEKRS